MSAIVEERDFDESIDLRALSSKLLDHLSWVVASVIICTTAFGIAAFEITPIYRASTIVAPASPAGDSEAAGVTASALGGLAAGLGLGPKNVETEEALAVLRSREFTENFISEKNLLPELFSSKWDPRAGRWKAGEIQPTLAQAYRYFDTRIRSIAENTKTGLITVQIDWTDQKEAADWANGMVSQLNDEMRARAIAQSDASMQFLEKELQSATTVEVREAIGRLMEVQVKHRMLAHVTRDYSFRIVDRAMSSDGERPIWPRKTLLLVLGAIFGLGAGTLAVVAFGRPRKNRT